MASDFGVGAPAKIRSSSFAAHKNRARQAIEGLSEGIRARRRTLPDARYYPFV